MEILNDQQLEICLAIICEYEMQFRLLLSHTTIGH